LKILTSNSDELLDVLIRSKSYDLLTES
jgi:hypothetical protein